MAKALVVGAGIHGISAALALARKGLEVEVLERRDSVLAGTSASTHNRAHRGYHYPRCMETAAECTRGLEYFETHYSSSLYYPRASYYAIEKDSSCSSTDQFIQFCEEAGIPYEMKWPDAAVLDRSLIECCLLVPEPHFNLLTLKEILLRRVQELNIRIHVQAEIVAGTKTSSSEFEVTTRSGQVFRPNIVVNAAYAFANNVLTLFGIADGLTKYRLQDTEIVVARVSGELPALTVMDGPFISVVPYVGHDRCVLVYDVVHSVIRETQGYQFSESNVPGSNWEKMVEHGLMYYPFMRDLRYVQSLRGFRPIPLEERKDGRKTRLVTHPSIDGLYSIQEGKFISAPLVAEDLANRIVADIR